MRRRVILGVGLRARDALHGAAAVLGRLQDLGVRQRHAVHVDAPFTNLKL